MSVGLGKYINDVLPAERAERPLLNVEITGTSPILWANAASIDVLVAEGRVEGPKSFTNGSVLLDEKEVASADTHLAFRLLN